MDRDEIFKTLGITPCSDLQLLNRKAKKSFKKLARRYHPDLGGDEAKFKKLSEAWEVFQTKEFQDGLNIPPPRTEDELFIAFRNYLLAATLIPRGNWVSLDQIRNMARSPQEKTFLITWVQMGVNMNYLTESYGKYMVNFIPSNITLIRFLRRYALTNIDRDSDAFRTIEQMYVKTLPKK